MADAVAGPPEEYSSARGWRQRPASRRVPTVVDNFLRLMRERGSGNIALAWRRYFDGDGDGELSFIEFCRALADIRFHCDVPALWIQLGGGVSGSLGLEALDPENAAVLEAFSRWCVDALGGPVEVFRAIDADGSDSLTADEFATGLRDLGFFSMENLPGSLASESLVLQNLYPLLDQSGHGCVTPDQLLFLEKDKRKRARIQRQIERIREHGADGAPEPQRNDARRLLHQLAVNTTPLSRKHWTQIRSNVACAESEPMPGSTPKGQRLQRNASAPSSLRCAAEVSISPGGAQGRLRLGAPGGPSALLKPQGQHAPMSMLPAVTR